ncbi:MAG: Hpt domain-containing protein [Bacteroidales bacterium]
MTYSEMLYDLTLFRKLDEEDPGALSKIVSVFINTTPIVLAELNAAFQSGDSEKIAQLAHKLKATIDILSIKPLTSVIREIEQIALTGNDSLNLPQLMKELNLNLELAISEISKEIS